MTNSPDTSPESVERLANRLGGTPLYDGSGEESDLPDNASATLRALSAALEAERVANGHEKRMRLDVIAMEQAATARAKAAEAELDEAVGVAARLADWIEHEAGCDLPFDARAIIARHQKETDT